jgi:hypothetical protein
MECTQFIVDSFKRRLSVSGHVTDLCISKLQSPKQEQATELF